MCLLALGLLTSATGCIDFSGSNNPIMSIELFWDERPATSAFVGGTCDSAGVSTMSWRLLDDSGRTVAVSGDGSEPVATPCTNGIDVVDPKPGTYHLSITGADNNDNPVWKANCTGLTVLRFDLSYECDICDAAHLGACK
jgi:hypothetical protein